MSRRIPETSDFEQWQAENPRSLALLKQQLDSCLQNHACGRQSDNELPTRVLDVGGVSRERTNIKLVQTSISTTKIDRFVALSYCWGSYPAFVTTPGTLEERTRGFSIETMPRTLRDAVYITRALGFRYLWIDALCILQGEDDEAVRDWERESARMESIYGNAAVTIVAAWASHCNGGILRRPEPGLTREFRSEPINSRAWALQEWLLSSRIVTFTSTATLFHCSSPISVPAQFGHAIYRFRFPLPPEQPRWLNWFQILGNYTSRNLKNPRDKLPAMAGLARRFDRLTGFRNGRYLAGLWEMSLLGDLLWRRDDLFGNFFNRSQVSAVRTGQAPSWSWASVDGIISYTTYFATGRPAPYTAEVVSCEVVLATADPYSMISSGTLVICGPSKAANSIRMAENPPKLFDQATCVGNLWLDLQHESATRDSVRAEAVFCLLVCEKGNHHALVLQRIGDNPSIYERVGLLISHTDEQRAWWADATSQTLTIV